MTTYPKCLLGNISQPEEKYYKAIQDKMKKR